MCNKIITLLAILCVCLTSCQKEVSTQEPGARMSLNKEIKLETRDPVLLQLFPENSLSPADREALLSLMKWSDLYELLDYPEKVKKIAIQYNDTITDKDLQFIENFPNLEELFLKNSSNITDDGMAVLTKLPHLKTLSVYGTKVTEASLPLIADLKNLENLYLGSMPLNTHTNLPSESPWKNQPVVFTDNSLKILEGSNLEKLWFFGPTNFTPEGLAYLATMKNLEVFSAESNKITKFDLESIKKISFPPHMKSLTIYQSGLPEERKITNIQIGDVQLYFSAIEN